MLWCVSTRQRRCAFISRFCLFIIILGGELVLADEGEIGGDGVEGSSTAGDDELVGRRSGLRTRDRIVE